MNRIYAGGDVSITYDVSASGSETFEAKFKTPSGYIVDMETSLSAPNITVTMDKSKWPDGFGGWGDIEVRRTDGTVDSVAVLAKTRVIGSILQDEIPRGYGW